MEPGLTKEEQLSVYLKMKNTESDSIVVGVLQSILDGNTISSDEKQTLLQYIRTSNMKTLEDTEKEKVASFYTLAKEYCSYMEGHEISKDAVDTLMELLMNLYIAALTLPDLEPDTIEDLPSEVNKEINVRINEQIDPFYWEVFDPYVQEEPVCGYLVDDLSGIADDLFRGIREYDAGNYGNAVFDWKLGFNGHWGNHLVNALRALHSVRTRDD